MGIWDAGYLLSSLTTLVEVEISLCTRWGRGVHGIIQLTPTMLTDFDLCLDTLMELDFFKGEYHSSTLLPLHEELQRPPVKTLKMKSKAEDRKRRRKRCTTAGCTNFAQLKGKCKAHGGFANCTVYGCPKRRVSKGVCFEHGGGKTCAVPNCHRAVQINNFCYTHGHGRTNDHRF